jgi:hypothetical protein
MTTLPPLPRRYRGTGYPIPWRERIVDEYVAGASTLAIARRTGLPTGTIYRIVNEAVKPRSLSQAMTAVHRDKPMNARCDEMLAVVRLRKGGRPWRDVARHVGRHKSTVLDRYRHPYAVAVRRYVYGEEAGPPLKREHVKAMRAAGVPEARIERVLRTID